jgi:hypothetical protein
MLWVRISDSDAVAFGGLFAANSLASDGARLLRPADMEPHLEEHSIIFAEINDGAAADGDAPALDEPEEGMEEMTAEARSQSLRFAPTCTQKKRSQAVIDSVPLRLTAGAIYYSSAGDSHDEEMGGGEPSTVRRRCERRAASAESQAVGRRRRLRHVLRRVQELGHAGALARL